MILSNKFSLELHCGKKATQKPTVTTAQQFSSFEKTLIFHLFLFIQFFVSACILFAEGEEFE